MPAKKKHHIHYRKVDGKNNPEYQRYRRAKRMRWINKYKVAKGCEICGYNAHPVALDFDHLERGDKIFNPSSRSLSYSLKKLFVEIRKCRILCSNCHRVHSYESKHFNNNSMVYLCE